MARILVADLALGHCDSVRVQQCARCLPLRARARRRQTVTRRCLVVGRDNGCVGRGQCRRGRRDVAISPSAPAARCEPLGLVVPIAALHSSQRDGRRRSLRSRAFITGASIAVFSVQWTTTMQREIPAHMLSRVSAYDWFGSLVFLPLGMALVGPVASEIGITTTLVGCGVLMVLLILATLLVPSVIRLTVPTQASRDRDDQSVIVSSWGAAALVGLPDIPRGNVVLRGIPRVSRADRRPSGRLSRRSYIRRRQNIGSRSARRELRSTPARSGARRLVGTIEVVRAIEGPS